MVFIGMKSLVEGASMSDQLRQSRPIRIERVLQREVACVRRARNIDLLSDVLIQGRNGNLRHQIARVYDPYDVRRRRESVNG